ncbi:LAME_0G05358g1_1 [Lachancea meyersii CBS 8951]|uniref:mitogen-activated protein kinase kinase n=1 Tax=Lachancea meyersii CBS 8951 TaxID=1266667 RepID=A0A1G4K758_9SACH|nr:LAME_0G05358g1_1 [Lachancea meyersii CBS 8951]
MAMDYSEPAAESTELRRSGSTSSSNYSNLNANLHARVKAFQEQRQLKRNGSVGSVGRGSNGSVSGRAPELAPATENSAPKTAACAGVNSRSMNVCHGSQKSAESVVKSPEPENIAKIVNKPLPPLPPSKESGHVLSPIRRAPRPPAMGAGASGVPRALHIGANGSATKAGSPAAASPMGAMKAKPSLSARRGLKLPAGGMSLKMKAPVTPVAGAVAQEFAAAPSNRAPGKPTTSRSNPGSLINGVPTTSTSSGQQRDTEGTTPQQQVQQQQSRSGSNGLFTNFSKYVDIKSGSLNFAGKLSLSSQGVDFSNGSSFRITLDELEFLGELGHGNYGNVSKVLHKPTNVIMAMKEVRLELDESKFTQILMELEVLHKCQSPYIVDFYGAFFIEGAVYMCIEYMDGGSLDKIYDDGTLGGIDEPQLACITNAIIHGLKELKDVHNIIHRDVKPTNLLCSAAQGTVKLCDFGVSGNLVASLAKTNIGCQSYMAPERIKSFNPDKSTYSVQSDVWSLGLSILEMAIGAYPYPVETFDNIFSQLSAIVDSPPPKLPQGRFSSLAQDFVNMCLQKIPERRPTYAALLEHPWLKTYCDTDVSMSEYISTRLQKKWQATEVDGVSDATDTGAIPALHKGGL